MARETVFPAAPATIGRGLVASPFQYYLTGTENLRIEAFGRSGPITVKVTWRFWHEADRRIQTNDGDFVSAGLGATTTKDLPLVAGALVGLRIGVVLTTLPLNWLWVRASIIQGLSGATRVVGTLVQGYVSSQADLAWPGSPLQNQHEGRGSIATINWLSLAGPLRLEMTVPTGLRWRPIGGRFGFTASAAAGNRDLLFATQDSSGNFSFVGTNGVVTAPSARQTYSFGAGLSPSSVTSASASQLPCPSDLELLAGEKITVQVNGVQAGDVFDSMFLTVREWFDL